MLKIRVHELAKEMNIPSKEVITKLNNAGIEVKNHMSTITEQEANKIKKGSSKIEKKEVTKTAPKAEAVEPAKTVGEVKKDEKPPVKKAGVKRDFRDERSNRPSYNRDRQRPQSRDGQRPSYNRDGQRPQSRDGQRPSYNRDGRPQSRDGQRPSYNRDGQRPQSRDGQRPSYNRDGRPQSRDGQRPSYNRDGRPQSRDGQRPSYNRDGRPQSRDGQRPSYNRDGQRPQSRDGRPSYNRDGRPQSRDGRPSYNRDGQRPQSRDGRPSYNRDGRPQSRDGRPSYNRDGRPQSRDGQRPSYNRDGRPQSRDGQRPSYNRDNRFGNKSAGVVKDFRNEIATEKVEKDTKSNYGNRKRDKLKQTPSFEKKERDIFQPRVSKHKKKKKHVEPKKPVFVPEVKRTVQIEDQLTVQELASQLGKKATEVIKVLIGLGVMATINQTLDFDTVQIIADEFKADIERVTTKEDKLFAEIEDKEEDLEPRSPVVTIMGHVDHGKTSLLDKIRSANVIDSEAGGITQHIGAYQVEVNKQKITFLDTPGHEAFTQMRARGAQVTDVAILVVAADDGVMPQTIEAIHHAKAAGVPIIVAINKIDKPEANPDKIKQELMTYELIPEDFGGDTIMVPVSAKQGMGIDNLLEMILLVSEVGELKANPNRRAAGIVIESKLDKGRGSVATLLVQKGTLHIGDFVIVGTTFGKVRAMFNYAGRELKKATPSMPVEILGLTDVPEAGDEFLVVEDEKLAKNVIERKHKEKHIKEIGKNTTVSLEDVFAKIKDGEIKDLNIIIKADVQGSVEAIRQSLDKLSNEEVRVNTIHAAVGGIKETDVMLAAASAAIILGFNVRPDANSKKIAEKENVDIRTYSIIYDAIEDVKAALSGLLSPEIKSVDMGTAEVRQVIRVPKVGNIAGAYITDGKFTRASNIRVVRDGVVIHDGKIDALKRFKDDVKEVTVGYECGISIQNFNDFKEGDLFEAYELQEIQRKL